MNPRCRVAIALMLGLAVACLAVVMRAVSAKAHDWYPMECCSGMDCAPADKVEIVPGPMLAGALLVPPASAAPSVMLVTTKHGTVAVPGEFPRRASMDGRLHVCMRPGQGGAMRLICVFLPPAM